MQGDPPGRARLVDVARAAGVSKALASRVLNGHALSIRPETRERVLTAARRLGYQPHAGARGLRRGETGALALLVPTLTNPVFALISRSAVAHALERGIAVLLIEDGAPQEADELVRQLAQSRRIDGVMVSSMQPEHPLLRTLDRLSVPHVFVHRTVPGSSRNVSMADQDASALAVDHLAALRHRRIAHVTGPPYLTTTQRLVEGFRRRAAELGLARPTIVNVDYSEAGGEKGARTLFGRRLRPTGVCTGSVTQAVGVLHAASELGLRVPDDLSLIACGELPLADFLDPPLTAISLPFGKLGEAAVDLLVAQLAGQEPRDVLVETHPEIIVRSSTGPALHPRPRPAERARAGR